MTNILTNTNIISKKLIVDEIIMLSAKRFDQIEHVCRKVRGNDLLWSYASYCLRIFFSTPPFPLKEDPGDFGSSAKTFLSVFRHKIILNKVMRQDKNDFVKAVNDISYS